MREARRPVVFFANGIGDTITSLPTLRALASIFDGRATLACDEWAWELFGRDLAFARHCVIGSSYVDGSRSFDAARLTADLVGTDLFLSLVPWHSRSMAQLLAGLGDCTTVGFYPDFQHTIPLDFTIHTADLTFEAARLLHPALVLEDFAEAPEYAQEDMDRVGKLMSALPSGTRSLMIHPETQEEKRWDPARLATVVDGFLDAHPEYMVFSISHGVYELPGLRHTGQVVPWVGQRLSTGLALVTQADLFLGVDSCFLHAADFSRVPSVGLFGPTDPREFGFRLAPHRHQRAPDHRMDSLSVSAVLAALEAIASEGWLPPATLPEGKVMGMGAGPSRLDLKDDASAGTDLHR